MKVVGIIVLVVLIAFSLWFAIDTTIYAVKKVKAKKQDKANKENIEKDNEVINGDKK